MRFSNVCMEVVKNDLWSIWFISGCILCYYLSSVEPLVLLCARLSWAKYPLKKIQFLKLWNIIVKSQKIQLYSLPFPINMKQLAKMFLKFTIFKRKSLVAVHCIICQWSVTIQHSNYLSRIVSIVLYLLSH